VLHPRHRVGKMLCAVLAALLFFSSVNYPLRGEAAAVTHVTITPTTLNLLVGATAAVVATVNPWNATNREVIWTSSATAIATVDAQGRVTAVSPGLAVITVTTADGGRTAGVAVSVASPPVRVTGVVLSATSLALQVGQTGQLAATVAPSGASNSAVAWSSSNAQIATVNALGLVTAVSPGLAMITVTTADGNFTAHAAVEVSSAIVPVAGVTVTPATLTLAIGATSSLSARVEPPNASNRTVVWASLHPLIAQVSATGVVTAISPGVASILATSTADPTRIATATVTVPTPAIPVSGVSVPSAALSLIAGVNHNVVATIMPANATIRLVRWASSNPLVANVSATGAIAAVSPGWARISVTTLDGGFTAIVDVTVTAPIIPVATVTLAPTTLALVVGGVGTLTPTVAPANATNRAVTWASANTQVATVNESGVVTAVAPGNTTITVRTTDGGRTATAAVAVAAPTISVTGVTVAPTTLSLIVGQTGSLAATVAPANATNRAVTWASADARVATVSATGVVTAVSPGLTVVSVTTADGGRTAAVAVTVAAPAISVASVVLAPATLTLPVGQSSALVAMVQPENAANRAVTWAGSQPLVAAVDARGIVTALSVGSAIITVTTVDGGHTAESSMVVVPPRAEMPIDPTATTILTLPDRASVVVPAGAISGVNARLLAEVVPVAPTSPLLTAASRAQLMPVSETVQLTLSGGTLDRALHLSQRFIAEQVPAGQVAALHVYNARTQRWIYLGGQVVDGAVTVGLADFGQFAVLATRPLPPLSDISNHWAQRPISTLSGMHIIGGHRDGTFRPDTQVSRAEFVAMLARALYLPDDASAAAHFRDAGTFSWAAGAIGAATKAGLVGGNADGNFAPARHISRAEIAVVLSRVVQQGLVTVPRVPAVSFADHHTIPVWAVSGVRMAAEAGLVHGAGDGRFNPNNFVTRAEVATMLYRLVAAR